MHETVLPPAPLAIAVLVSGQGRGTNLQALLDGCSRGTIEGRIALVVGTRSDAPALDRARGSGSALAVVSPRRYEGHEEGYSAALLRLLKRHRIELICLAGYMRRLPMHLIAAYSGRIMNVHPALLPEFGGHGMYGEYVHRAVIDSGTKWSGATVHFVDEDYDTGPIITQKTVPVLPDDTPVTLAARVLEAEHSAYVEAVRLFAAGRLHLEAGRVTVEPA